MELTALSVWRRRPVVDEREIRARDKDIWESRINMIRSQAV